MATHFIYARISPLTLALPENNPFIAVVVFRIALVLHFREARSLPGPLTDRSRDGRRDGKTSLDCSQDCLPMETRTLAELQNELPMGDKP
jgi:hypothetical protein